MFTSYPTDTISRLSPLRPPSSLIAAGAMIILASLLLVLTRLLNLLIYYAMSDCYRADLQ